MNTMETTKSKIEKETLEMIKDIFEKEKKIKILSLYEEKGNIYGVYINQLHDSLSFLKAPLFNMRTDFIGYPIFMMELGLLLQLIYNNASMQMFVWLTHPSAIDCSNDFFDNLISKCSSNPPLRLSSLHLIRMIDELNDDILEVGINDLVDMVEFFMMIEPLDIDVSMKDDEVLLKNNLNKVQQELMTKEYDKISELTLIEIDELFILLQKNFEWHDSNWSRELFEDE